MKTIKVNLNNMATVVLTDKTLNRFKKEWNEKRNTKMYSFLPEEPFHLEGNVYHDQLHQIIEIFGSYGFWGRCPFEKCEIEIEVEE